MKKEFVIIGPADPESDDNLYWSQANGWGNFADATRFTEKVFCVLLPLETKGIMEVINNVYGPVHILKRSYEKHLPILT